MNIIEATSVSKHFAGHTALNDLSLSIPKHSIFGLLGPNGAGKTTFIRIINQIIGPDTGTVFFNGKKLSSEHISMIGYLPEERGLYKKMKVGELALYLARLKGLSKTDAMSRLKKWFEIFEINSWWNKKVEELSKGMQQKVQFIVTVVHEPELLIFDEPFSGFDPINVNLLKDQILRLQEKGATIIFSTHNMASVEQICDHIVLINKAEKILEGRVDDIKLQNRDNTIEVVYSGGALQSVLKEGYVEMETSDLGSTKRSKIQIPTGSSSNDLIKLLVSNLELHSFKEIMPTMDEIFISKVNEDKRN